MTTLRDYQALHDRIAGLREETVRRLSAEMLENPHIVSEALTREINELFDALVQQDAASTRPTDGGLAELAGLGANAAPALSETRVPHGVEAYDETVTSERIIAVGDIYYLYQHEMLGVFRTVKKLQELYRAGAVRLSSGEGAFALYQFDRREVLRYTQVDRAAAYARVLGYGRTVLAPGARANTSFHRLFTHFNNEVAQYWRDKRITDVIRQRAHDPSFGNIAVVRRSGLDLRNNLKFMSYGHISALRVEVMQLLEEAFRILSSDDVMRLFGAENAWDVVEEVLVRYFNERLETSPRQRMAVAGREVLRWLAHPHILQTSQGSFEALLREIADSSEEWLTSAQALGMANREAGSTVLTRPRRAALPTGNGRNGRSPRRNGTDR